MKKTILITLLIGSGYLYSQNIGINTTGAAASNLNMLEILQISTTANSVGLDVEHSGPLSGGNTGYAFKAIKTGATGINVAGFFSATGGGSNYALIIPSGGGNVGIGTSAPDSKAILDLTSTTQGVFFPRMTTAQRDAIVSPPTSLMIYNTTTNCLELYSGTAWLSSCSGFSNSGGNPCSVVGGTASASPTTGICGVSTTLNLLGSVGSTHQWQRSSNNSFFIDIPGATSTNYVSKINSSISASASEYFRCRVSDGTCTAYSNTINLTNTCASNTWCKKTDCPITARIRPVSFTVGSYAYMGTGGYSLIELNDFWRYDPATDSWTQMADFAGAARYGAAGFAIGSKGYVGTGLTDIGSNTSVSSDFYEYDPSTNTWTAKASVPVARAFAVGISDGTSGYIATGAISGGTASAKVYKYNVGSNTWSTMTDLTNARIDAVAFNIGTSIYIATGAQISMDGSTCWSTMERSTNGGSTWTARASITGARSGAFAFSTSTKGYVGGGHASTSARYDTFYEYDDGLDTWTAKTSYPQFRAHNTAFCINNIGYVCFGINVTTGFVDGSTEQDEMYQYYP